MAESDNTVMSLMEAFTTLMCELPFSKISVVDICQKCNINRKSFYYHFKDKYDLMNSKFDMEFPMFDNKSETHDKLFLKLFNYFHENRIYYRKVFMIEGQNSFTEHLHEKLKDYILSSSNCKNKFRADFFANGIIFATKEWINDKNGISPFEFYKQLESCINLSIQIK